MQMKFILTTLAGLIYSQTAAAATNDLYNNPIPDCKTLGYDTNLTSCPSSKVSHPIHCPYDYNKVKCWKTSCPGYPFADKSKMDTRFPTEECLAGIENGKEIKFYRYKNCINSGTTYRFNNGECMDRCDLNKYPYTDPPGSLFGDVEECYDSEMHYGYTTCREGFGKLVNGKYLPENGQCNMLICDVYTYPYFSEPDKSRGTIESCAGGTNKYYRYTACNNGYNLRNGVCYKKFDITASDQTYKNGGMLIGDVLTYNGTEIAMVVHTPDASDNRYLAAAYTYFSGQFSPDTESIDMLPQITSKTQALEDKKGKCNTLAIYKAVQSGRQFPQVKATYTYYPSVCGQSNSYCGAGQWYVPAFGEVAYFYQNYLLYNGFKHFYQAFELRSSTSFSTHDMWFLYGILTLQSISNTLSWPKIVPFIEFGSVKTTCS